MSITYYFSKLFVVLRKSLLTKDIARSMLYAFLFIVLYFIVFWNPLNSWFGESRYQKLEKDIVSFESRSSESDHIQKIAKSSFDNVSKKELIRLDQEHLFFHIYSDTSESPTFWSKKSYYLPKDDLEKIQSTKYRYFEKKNYLIRKVKVDSKLIVLWFDIDKYITKYMCNSFHFFNRDENRKEYKVIGYSEPHSKQIKNAKGEFLFSILKTNYGNDLSILLGLFFIVISCLFLLTALYSFTKSIAVHFPTTASILFFIIIYGLRKILMYFKLPSLFYSLKLFNPALYTSEVTPSLGDLLIFVISSQLILIFLKRHFVFPTKWINRNHIGFLVHTLALIFLMGESFSINKIFDRMVVESSIWFNFNYFPRLSLYSFIGLAIMLLSFSNYYLLSNFIIRKIVDLKLNRYKILSSFAFVFCLIIVAIFSLDIRFEIKATFILLLFFIVLFYLKYQLKNRSRIFDFSLFLIFASFTTTFLLYQYNGKKEEAVLSSIASNVSFGIDSDLELKIQKTLLSYDFSRAKVNIDSSLDNVIGISKIDELDYYNFLEDESVNFVSNSLLIEKNKKFKLFFDNSKHDKKYIAELLTNNTKQHFAIYPRNYLNDVSQSSKEAINDVIIRDDRISYGLYVMDSLRDYSGFYSYPLVDKTYLNNTKIKEKFLNVNVEHFVYSFADKVRVVVTVLQENPVSILTQFSYIFCINLVLFLILLFLANAFNLSESPGLFQLRDLRSKIVFAVFLIVITIFSGITYLSFSSLRSKFKDYNREVLLNNLKITQHSIKKFFAENPKTDLRVIISYLDDLNKNSALDFNLFDPRGFQLYDSKSQQLSNSQVKLIAPRLIKDLKVESSRLLELGATNAADPKYELVSVITANQANSNYFLAISTNDEIKTQSDATKLIVVLLNLYVIFFLLSMAFAIWMANRITKPLQMLTDKISKINLSKQNEYLEYQYEDEIGDLVKRYNSMVVELEESAKMIAFQEREEAWSEMAKQIAHEIKNPLTPMKLKIQYLQRKIKEGADDIGVLSANVSETLIEQINNLDNIATSFSNFSKLHNPVIEKLDWLSLVRNVASMFENQKVRIELKTNLRNTYVQCDRNQMVSCLNNIVKNAIQAQLEEGQLRVDIQMVENDKYYILHIQDYGKGIKEENRSKIFTPNFTTKSSGTGLGLAITKKIIDSIDGHISFSSNVGKGTCFTISLPKVDLEDEEIKYSELEKTWISKGMIAVLTTNIAVDLVYTSKENVFHSVLYNDFDKAFLTELAYFKLVKAAGLLEEKYPNYRLLVLDALRPYAVQRLIWDAYSGVDKSKYIASPDRDSMHNYGMAVDVLILRISEEPGEENTILDFGCSYDEFSEKASYNYSNLSTEQKKNRDILYTIMKEASFVPYENEFWHFEAMDKGWVRENCERF